MIERMVTNTTSAKITTSTALKAVISTSPSPIHSVRTLYGRHTMISLES